MLIMMFVLIYSTFFNLVQCIYISIIQSVELDLYSNVDHGSMWPPIKKRKYKQQKLLKFCSASFSQQRIIIRLACCSSF